MLEWLRNYLKHKDLLQKKLKDFRTEGNILTAIYKDKEKRYLVMENFEEKDFSDIDGIVVLNKEDNLKKIIKAWPKLIKYTGLCLYSINPDSTTEQKWAVFPSTHHQITGSLKKGLRSMFETVDPVR